MAFNETNPETSRPWTRAELFQELEKLKAIKTFRASSTPVSTGVQVDASGIISWPQQSANLRARWNIHTKEFNIAIKDLKTLAKAIEVFIENQREYWATNPLVKQ